MERLSVLRKSVRGAGKTNWRLHAERRVFPAVFRAMRRQRRTEMTSVRELTTNSIVWRRAKANSVQNELGQHQRHEHRT